MVMRAGGHGNQLEWALSQLVSSSICIQVAASLRGVVYSQPTSANRALLSEVEINNNGRKSVQMAKTPVRSQIPPQRERLRPE